MADIASKLANECGISTESAQKGLGMVLGLMKSKLPAETFSQVSAAVPDADRIMADTGGQASGLLSAVKGAVGKIFGGGADTPDAVIAKFGQLGMKPEQVQAFIPKVMEFLKGKLPANVMEKVSGLLPTPQEAAH